MQSQPRRLYPMEPAIQLLRALNTATGNFGDALAMFAEHQTLYETWPFEAHELTRILQQLQEVVTVIERRVLSDRQ